MDLRGRLRGAGGAKKPVFSTSRSFMMIGRPSYPTAKWECYLKARCVIPSCLQQAGKMKSSKWLLCVISEGRMEKIPMTFCCTCCLRRDMLSMVRPHSMQILKACMQKFETRGFVDPGRKSRFQTGAQKKNLPFHQYLLLLYWWMDAARLCCGFCPIYLLNLCTFYFWAIVVSRADR